MKQKEIEFSMRDLIASVEDFADHLQEKKKLTLRVRNLPLPRKVNEIKPKEIVALRRKLSLSQAVFARALNVPKVTEISWEKGRRRPTGAALRLLDLVRRNPRILEEIWDPHGLRKAA